MEADWLQNTEAKCFRLELDEMDVQVFSYNFPHRHPDARQQQQTLKPLLETSISKMCLKVGVLML